jgi:hypothetical protein
VGGKKGKKGGWEKRVGWNKGGREKKGITKKILNKNK